MIRLFIKSIVLSLLLVVLFPSCSRSFQKNQETLILSLRSDPKILNPLLSEDAYSSAVISPIYETLLERDNETLAMKGLLAERWTVSPDNFIFTFYLRRGVKFHDGEPMTARDVIFTYKKIMDPATPNPQLKVYFNDVAAVYMPDEYTVMFVMKRPYFKTLEILGGMEILPEHIFSKVENFVINDYNLKNPIGTGPYKFSKWKTGQKIVLVRNENYWGKIPDIKKYEYRIIEEDAINLQALKKQELDVYLLNTLQWIRQTGSEKFNKIFRKEKYLSTSFNYIGYNTRKYPFDDKRVRQAMTYLIDREKIRMTILNGLAEITTGNFWINSDQYNRNLKPYEYDPAKALALLKDAGFEDTDQDGILDKNGKKLSFEVLVPIGPDFYRRVTPIIKEDMRKYGVEFNIRDMQFQALVDKMNKRDFDALMLAWSMGIETDPYQLWHSTQLDKGHNFTGFSTPEMDYLIEKARLEFNPEIRNKMYHRFHEILYENQPYTFMFTNYNLLAIHRRFQHVNIYKTGPDYREWTLPE